MHKKHIEMDVVRCEEPEHRDCWVGGSRERTASFFVMKHDSTTIAVPRGAFGDFRVIFQKDLETLAPPAVWQRFQNAPDTALIIAVVSKVRQQYLPLAGGGYVPFCVHDLEEMEPFVAAAVPLADISNPMVLADGTVAFKYGEPTWTTPKGAAHMKSVRIVQRIAK